MLGLWMAVRLICETQLLIVSHSLEAQRWRDAAHNNNTLTAQQAPPMHPSAKQKAVEEAATARQKAVERAAAKQKTGAKRSALEAAGASSAAAEPFWPTQSWATQSWATQNWATQS